MAICFDSQGQLLVAGLAGGVLCVWRAADGQLLREYQSFDAGAQALNLASMVDCWSAATPTIRCAYGMSPAVSLLYILAGHPATPWSLMLSIDNTLLASGGVDGVIHIWDAQTGQLKQTFRGHTKAVVALAFTRMGRS